MSQTATLPAHGHAPEAEQPNYLARYGMMTFLCSEAMLFAGLIGAYIVLRMGLAEWPPAGSPNYMMQWPMQFLNWVMIGNTCVLVSSSWTYHKAEEEMHHGKSGAGWLLVSCIFGAFFLCVQGYEWHHLASEGMWFGGHALGGVYGSTFFIMTGFHGLHVFIGLILLTIAFFKALGRQWFPPAGGIPKGVTSYDECAGMYWHFVDVVWVFLFLVIYTPLLPWFITAVHSLKG